MIDQDTTVVSAILQRIGSLKTTRNQYETVLQDISDLILPNRQDFNRTTTEGKRRDICVYDTTAIQANEMLAAALYSGLTSVSSRWFGLRPSDSILESNENVKRWIAKVLDIMYAIFNSSESNFPQQNHELLLDLVAYGTGCMYIDEEEGSGIRFITRHLSEIYIVENSKGVVDTVIRPFKYSARQAAQEWGEEKLGAKVKQSLLKKPDDKFEFVQAVLPRKDAERMSGGSINLPPKFSYVCYYISVDDKKLIDMKGYYENPFVTPRWEKLVGESYGRSPGWNCLADVKMINTMSETMIRAAQKQVDPPLIMADDGVVMPLETFPSGVNIGAVSADGRPLIQPLASGGRYDIGLDIMNQRRDSIRKAYFVDQFEQKDGTPLSASEWVDRREDRLRLTGPQLFRLQSEYLSKVIDRVFSICQRNGLFPEPPEELANVTLNVEYVSPLVRSQRGEELMALNRALQATAVLWQQDPTLLDNFDGDTAIREAAMISGVPLKQIRIKDQVDPATVEQVRESRNQQIEQQQQQEQLMQGADAASKLKKSGIDIGI